jgi:hypothetical protein
MQSVGCWAQDASVGKGAADDLGALANRVLVALTPRVAELPRESAVGVLMVLFTYCDDLPAYRPYAEAVRARVPKVVLPNGVVRWLDDKATPWFAARKAEVGPSWFEPHLRSKTDTQHRFEWWMDGPYGMRKLTIYLDFDGQRAEYYKVSEQPHFYDRHTCEGWMDGIEDGVVEDGAVVLDAPDTLVPGTATMDSLFAWLWHRDPA